MRCGLGQNAVPAIDGDGLALDHLCQGAGEQDCHIRNVLGCGDASAGGAHAGHFKHRVAHGKVVERLGVDHTRA